jgi:hypothetical protein
MKPPHRNTGNRNRARGPANAKNNVCVRLTDAEFADWQARAKADNITVSQYIRNAMAAYRTDED